MGVTTLHRERFDEADIRGWLYNIAIGDQPFPIRAYDDIPGRAIIRDTTTARQSPVVKQVVSILLSQGYTEIQFYCGPDGFYRAVDSENLLESGRVDVPAFSQAIEIKSS